jgi:dTDP-4-dehydrorhamnose reductase
MFMKLPERQHIIARLPMVFGSQSPRTKELKYHLDNKQAYEVFPNLVMNVTSDNILTRQLHYMINRRRKGIFHLGSTDLIHHNEFIKECCSKLGVESPFFKNVYTSNFDRFLAVLPKHQHLPHYLRFTQSEVVEELR